MKISVRVSRVSREGKNAIYCVVCESRNLRDSQTNKIIIHSEKLVLDPNFSQDFRVKISNDSRKSRYEICVWETHESRKFARSLASSREASLATKFLSARLVRSNFRYEISVSETREKRVALLILTRESGENLARILGLKSESRLSREFQKGILVSTLQNTVHEDDCKLSTLLVNLNLKSFDSGSPPTLP